MADYNLKKSRLKIAVIGTGASSLGIFASLIEKQSKFDLFVYDIGRDIAEAPLPQNPSKEWIKSFYDGIYKEIRSVYSFKFPPPKTHFSSQISKEPVGRLNILKGDSLGGLTNYWGATMLPFTDRELSSWPISYKELYPYYKKIAKLVGLAGRPDALNGYFRHDFSTRPPIKPVYILDYLNETVNSYKGGESFRVISGLNRCALETRQNHPNHCVYCGECMAGCFRNSIYSTKFTIKKYLKDERVKKYIKSKVRRIDQKGKYLEIETEGDIKERGFDYIFLCAGCPSSTEIIIRSLGLNKKLTMADNAVYVFPIFYLGKRSEQGRRREYLSLSNIIFGCLPNSKNEHFAQAQVYPNFDYLWRYNIPSGLWPAAKLALSPFWSRIFWARLYLHSDYSQNYSIGLESNKLIMSEGEKATANHQVRGIMSSIKSAVNHNLFYIPPVSPVLQKVNTHYAGTIPYNGKEIYLSDLGEVMPGLFLCDSSSFPDSPAVNPAFTSMANAYRIADCLL